MVLFFTGLRPGEKLYEELVTEGEGIVSTDHDKILVLRNGKSNDNNTDAKYLEEKIDELIESASRHDPKQIKCKLKEMVPEYTMSDDECIL